jgi:hypothetical protein
VLRAGLVTVTDERERSVQLFMVTDLTCGCFERVVAASDRDQRAAERR